MLFLSSLTRLDKIITTDKLALRVDSVVRDSKASAPKVNLKGFISGVPILGEGKDGGGKVSQNRYAAHLAYVAVGLASLLLAIFVSSRMVRSSFSQEPPRNRKVPSRQSPDKIPSCLPLRNPRSGVS